MLNAMVDFLHGRKHSHADDVPKKTRKATRESVDKQLKKGVSDGPPCCSSDPVQQLNDVQRMGSVLQHEIEDAANDATVAPAAIEATEIEDQKMPSEEIDEVNAAVVESSKDVDEAEKLHKMGLNTAIAIGLHNFPEGECKQKFGLTCLAKRF